MFNSPHVSALSWRWQCVGSLVVLLAGSSAQAQLQIVTYIEQFTTAQTLNAGVGKSGGVDFNNPPPVTNTVASAGSIGGYRTLSISLNSAGIYTEDPASLRVTTTSPARLIWSSALDLYDFQMMWNGSGGSSGLGGFQFGNGQSLDLATSFLTFTVRSSDILDTPFLWKFTDIQNRSASLAGGFPTHTSSQPPTGYNLFLNQFTNGGTIDWNAVKTIEFSGGGTYGFDMSIQGPITFTANVPEPASGMLVMLGGAALLALRRIRSE